MNDVTISKILKIYNEEVSKNVRNKKKINDFEKYKITYLESIYNVLISNNYKPLRYNIFLIRDPKYRIIMSQGIYDKVINHYIARYVLEDKLSKYLDNRNVATRKNMGSSYGLKLLLKYIEALKRNNSEFYILKLDISKYFYSIDHEVLKSLLKDKLTKEEYYFLDIIISSTNEDYINNRINYLKNKEIINNPKRIKEINELPIYEKGKGLCIGAITNQFLAIFYLYKLHNYIIHKLKLKYTVIYMDDYIIMHKDKEYLKKCLIEIQDILNNIYKLKLNTKKTKITSSKEGFVFLEYYFKVINNKTIIKLRKSTLRKIKKNIKKQEYLFKNKKIQFKTLFSCINNYENCFKYDKIKVSRILDKYTG